MTKSVVLADPRQVFALVWIVRFSPCKRFLRLRNRLGSSTVRMVCHRCMCVGKSCITSMWSRIWQARVRYSSKS